MRLAEACSGPGAGEAIALSSLVALASLSLGLAFLAVLVVRGLRRRAAWKRLLPLAVVCAAHPFWWLSPLSGDCGFLLRWASLAFLPVLAVVIYVGLRRSATVTTPGSAPPPAAP